MKKILMIAMALAAVTVSAADKKGNAKMEKATFAAGCFWGVESIYQQIPGVIDTKVGYTGGKTDHPTYKDVCDKDTGHAEAIEITFDPDKVSYEELLDIFWRMHNPTTPNRQGPDVGSQYRSAVFYHSEAQKKAAEKEMKKAQKDWKYKIVTQLVPAATFYDAEDYHQKYFEKKGIKKNCHFLRE